MNESPQQHKKKRHFIKIFFDFYIFSNIHVALATAALTKITLLNIGISENKTALFVFFATLLSYNVIRFLRLNDIKNWYNDWIKINLNTLYFISILSLLFLLYFAFQLRFKAILYLIPFAITTFFYTFPIKKMSLRNIAGLKLFLIAISWAGITVLFPLIQNYMSIQTNQWITFIQRFLLVIVITLPFDIRDLDYDNHQLKTIPQQIGIQKTKVIGILLLVLFFFIEFFKMNIEAKSVLITLSIATLSAILLVKSDTKQHKYFSAFYVESIPIVWLLFIVLWSM